MTATADPAVEWAMPDEPTSERLRAILPGGEWWLYAGMYQVLMVRPGERPDVRMYTAPVRDGCTISLHTDDGFLGSITFTAKGIETTIRAEPANSALVEMWAEAIRMLHATAYTARDIRRDTVGHTTDEVIEAYYRSRAQGSRVTLKQLAQATGFSHSYLLKRKMLYDRAGKWGSKSSKENKQGKIET